MSVGERNPDDIKRIEQNIEGIRGIVEANLFPQDRNADGIRVTTTNVTSLTKAELRDAIDGRVDVESGFEDPVTKNGDRETYFIPVRH